jgi:hypothetical protein
VTDTPTSVIDTPTPAPSPTQPELALTEFPVAGVEMNRFNVKGGLEVMKQANAYWARRNALFWSDVEPTEGARDWEKVASLEQELKDAASQGLQVILIVRSAPEWAQKMPGVSCGPIKEDKLNAFASFMHDLVVRYSAPPFQVKYWEMGNEPDIDPKFVTPDNIFGCWGDENDAYYGGGYYAQMLKAVYPQIKSADSQAQVLTGGLLLTCDPVNPPETAPNSGKEKNCTPSRFLEGILKNGGGDYFDAVSFHAYDYYNSALGVFSNSDWHSASDTTGPGLIVKARFLRSVLAAYGYPDKPLFNTENALLCLSSEEKCKSDDFNLTKAYFAVQAYASARAEGLLANIWYSALGWRYSGLVTNKLDPMPVYEAYAFSAKELGQSAFVAELGQYSGVKGYEFQNNSARIWVLWSLDREPHTIQLDQEPSAIYDSFGQSMQAAEEITISLAPIYLEWSATK